MTIRKRGSRSSEEGEGRTRLRGRLVAFLKGLDLGSADLTDETSLLRSGLFDSMALFHLVEWVERQIGAPVDPTSFDFLREWDTVPGILAFIERRRGAGATAADGKDQD